MTAMDDQRLPDFGLRISRELAGETAAIAAVLADGTGDDRDIDARILDRLIPKRAADKRQAIAQRRRRISGRLAARSPFAAE